MSEVAAFVHAGRWSPAPGIASERPTSTPFGNNRSATNRDVVIHCALHVNSKNRHRFLHLKFVIVIALMKVYALYLLRR
jgi:hypothetical protein